MTGTLLFSLKNQQKITRPIKRTVNSWAVWLWSKLMEALRVLYMFVWLTISNWTSNKAYEGMGNFFIKIFIDYLKWKSTLEVIKIKSATFAYQILMWCFNFSFRPENIWWRFGLDSLVIILCSFQTGVLVRSETLHCVDSFDNRRSEHLRCRNFY